MTLQAHFSIFHHCRAEPVVHARSRDGFFLVDIAAADSGGLLLTIHCATLEAATQVAEKLSEVFAIARGKQKQQAIVKQLPSDYWEEVPSEQIKP